MWAWVASVIAYVTVVVSGVGAIRRVRKPILHRRHRSRDRAALTDADVRTSCQNALKDVYRRFLPTNKLIALGR